MDPSSLPHRRLRLQVILRLVLALPVLMACLFLPAGTFAFWEAWVYLAVLFLPLTAAAVWLLRNSPRLLARRLQLREPARVQVVVLSVAGALMTAAFVLPGLDHRWGWSTVPTAVVLAADAGVLASYLLIFRVQQVNAYASRTVRVEEGQQVIDSGPYGVVRHPMYAGMLGFMLATPVALGSWWAVLPALGVLPALMARAVAEEEVLRRDLPGYDAYTERVRHRLIPGVW